MKKLLFLLALSLFQLELCARTFKTTVTAPSDVSMTVFEGFRDSTKVLTPVSKSVRGGIARYVYDLAPGNYHFVSSGYGYLSLNKNFTVSDKARTVDADPGRLGEKGYQQIHKMTFAYTDETSAVALGTGELSRRFPSVLTTPAFNPGKPVGEHTTQRELEEFLGRLDKSDADMHTFTAGFTTQGRRIPLVVFTTSDINGMSLEEAGKTVVSNGKPSIFLHAEIHGDESSPCEGALAMCAELHGSYGRRVLPEMNVIIMPRINCDGAQQWTRGTSVSPDMNRDNLLCLNPEVKATHRVYNAFQPAIVLDMHEYGVAGNFTKTEGYLDDAGITVGGNRNNSKELNGLQKEMMRYVEKAGADAGIRFWEYTQAGYSDQSPIHASHYYALRSSVDFLVETPSSRSEKRSSFARRTFTQFFAAYSLIEYAMKNASAILSTCELDRKYVSSTDDPFILRYGQNKEAYTYKRPFFSYVDGHKIEDRTFSVRYYEVPLITRHRAAAYVIPKDAAGMERILEIAGYNGITYEEIAAGTTLKLQQYAQNPKWRPLAKLAPTGNKRLERTDDCEKFALLEPQETTFDKGAYIFKTAQPGAIVLMLLMEPDFIQTDGYPVSLVQADLLRVGDIYRIGY